MGEKEVEKAVNEIRKQEKRNREFRFLRKVLKPMSGNMVPEVDVPEDVESIDEMWEMLKQKKEAPEKWKKVKGRQEVEAVLLEWNRKYCNQSAQTLIMSWRWEKVLNIMDEKNQVNQILENGEVDLPIELKECVEWVEKLKRKEIPEK